MSTAWQRAVLTGLALTAVALAAGSDTEMRARTGTSFGLAPPQTEPLAPNAVNGLLLWLDAARGVALDADGRVERWDDQSGHATHLVQADPSLRVMPKPGALSGLPVLAFSGFHGHHTETFACGITGTIELGSHGITVLAVLQQREEIFAGALFKYGPDNNRRGVGLFTNDLGAWVDPERDYGGSISGGGRLVGAGFQVLALRADFAKGAAEIYRNGQRVGHTQRADGFQVEPKGTFQLGGGRVAHTNCAGSCASDLAEFVLFDHALTDPERAGVEAYLRAKWGLDRLQTTTALAARLPFAYYPSVGELELAFDKAAPLLWEHLGAATRPAAEPGELATGLAWATYAGGKLPEDWATATPETTGTVADLDLPSGAFDPVQNTAHALSGWLDVPRPGAYTFVLRPQSASVLQVDGVVVADQSASKDTWGTWNWCGSALALARGRHRLHVHGLAQPRRVEHENLPLVLWSGPGFWRQPIPAACLSHGGGKVGLVPPPLDQAQARPLPEVLAELTAAPFRVVDSHSDRSVATGTLKLDGAGRGQARFRIGDLPEGEYAVEYDLAGTPVRLPQTFTRVNFPWEGNTLGKGHEVLPPYVPVRVDGNTVRIVDRAYRLNAFGLLDSCRSQGRELLAAPMFVVAKAGSKVLTWTRGRTAGKVLFPDQAEFTGSARTDALRVTARTTVEEDGCCRVEWTLTPGRDPTPIDWLELVIPLKETEATLFGWAGQDSMRHHYWGLVPSLGEILWDTEQGKAPTWVPAAWRLGQGAIPADGRVWDSTRNLHWTQGNRDPFVCYVWLGGEERGLAWFADRPAQFTGAPDQPRQLVCREPGRVALRVRVIQQPTLIREPRRLVFGLQASPTKPLRSDWRTHNVPGGGGLPVVCWGGYYCSSKYPDNHDYTVVDQIMRMATEDKPGLEEEVKAKLKELDGRRLWKDLKLFGTEEWYGNTLMYFVSQAHWKNCAAYVEEHAHQVRMPEWQVFQDEWAGVEFNRFQGSDANWGMLAPGYHDFAVYYQHEFLRRGVSLYYDNSMPRQERNPFVLDREPDTAAGLWGLRDYYKRTWKNLQRLERNKVPPLPLDFTIHLTNTKLLPLHTWATNLLDLEQPYRSGLPFPPDYTRAMTSGRQVGVIAHGMFPLANYNDYRDPATSKWTEEQALADWAMFQTHEVRGTFYADWRQEWKQWKSHRDALVACGYGSPQATVINYWQPVPPVKVSGSATVTWIAVLPPAASPPPGVLGVILLQSYAQDGARATVAWTGARALVDHRTRQAAGNGERAAIELPGRFGTRLLWAVTDPAAAVPPP